MLLHCNILHGFAVHKLSDRHHLRICKRLYSTKSTATSNSSHNLTPDIRRNSSVRFTTSKCARLLKINNRGQLGSGHQNNYYKPFVLQKSSLPLYRVKSLPETQEESKLETENESSGDEDTFKEAEEQLNELRRLTDLEKELGAYPRRREHICTGDELHLVASGDWNLALWRYKPPLQSIKRNHPVLLLTGIATNALGYDLDPDVSLARHLRELGFDTWILEVRGMGLSHLVGDEIKSNAVNKESETDVAESRDEGEENKTEWEEGDDDNVNSRATQSTEASEHVKRKREVEDINNSGSRKECLTGTERLRDGMEERNYEEMNIEVSNAQEKGNISEAVEEELVEGGRINQAEDGEDVEFELLLARLLEIAAEDEALSGPITELTDKLQGLSRGADGGTNFDGELESIRPLLERLESAIPASDLNEKVEVRSLTEKLWNLLDPKRATSIGGRISGVRSAISDLVSDAQQAVFSGSIRNLFMENLSRFSSASDQIVQLRDRIATVRQSLEETLLGGKDGKDGASPQLVELRESFLATISDAQKSLENLGKYDWDFDTLLYEDVANAVEYVKGVSEPKDGKILAVGHSMGGILLYSRLAVMGSDASLAAIVTVASSMDYSPSRSSLKLLLPLEGPIKLTGVPIIPTGILSRSAIPLITRPPYSLAWIGWNISAPDMMDPNLFEKLMSHNFETIPVNLLLQMASLFYDGGLKNRSGTVQYRKGLRDCKTPVLALAGDKDLVCPPVAVTDTINYFPEGAVTYKLYGGQEEEGGLSYSHFDLIVGKTAKSKVFPVISDFLVRHDELTS